MFRIKTDIRQFKCESEEKVERLIRSWVIRPTDLIFYADDERWSAISEHPTFGAIFLDLSAALQPAASKDAAEADASAMTAQPSPPQPPEGVEPPVVSEEVTVMTDRTVDLLGLQDEAPPSSPPVAPEGLEPVAAHDESTQIFAREDADASASPRSEIAPSAPPRIGRHDLPEELFLTSEIARPFDADEGIIDELRGVPTPDDIDEGWGALLAVELRSTDEFEDQREPEEDLRATQEFDASAAREQVTQLTPMAEPSPAERAVASVGPSPSVHVDPSLSEVDGPSQAADSPPALNAEAPEAAAQQEEAGLAPELEAQALSAPVAIDQEVAIAAALAHEEARRFALAETAELPSLPEPAPTSLIAQPPPHSEDEDPEGSLDAVTDAYETTPREPSEPVAPALMDAAPNLDDVPFEGAEAVVDALDEDPYEDAPHPATRGKAAVVQNLDHVSEGYSIELPFAIKPTAEDAAFGVFPSTLSPSLKDRSFPLPQPKKNATLEMKRLRGGHASAPRHSAPWPFLLVAFALVLGLLLLTLVLLPNL